MSSDYGDFTIVLPTLNEGKNIGMLVSRLLGEYKGIKVIVVDDGSKDNTKEEVNSISRRNRNVRFIDRSSRKEKGLTASAAEGILSSKTKFAIVMDADLQHPTSAIGKMASELSHGSHLVVAVRADVHGWELYRKIISKTLIVIGYAALFLRRRARCKDIFSGFFGVEKSLFSKVYNANRGRFVSSGYKILYDFLKCVNSSGIGIAEVPYSFGLRKYGTSKAGFKQGLLLFKSFLT
ncbi:MAG: glycosyltransferase [Candidatus Micrarchaeota archaeon]|nr:glycosyltransferase [Candidatus Micrarchaeota archaeon]MDE1833753.1 glycosyltransferase [Candidatus Micrarchaeota archaeon]MDE1859934.1 glycosyltransferase [Candidatus Micrarchaeota archaeon]